jgi:UDP-2,3-diacylglucosamine pyrophosphatase LpxH
VQQRTDAATAEFVAYLKSQRLVKAVLCGHCHKFWEERFSQTAMMYVADATYHGGCNEIEFA